MPVVLVQGIIDQFFIVFHHAHTQHQERCHEQSVTPALLREIVVDDPESYEEISASAGIAAAMLTRGNPLHSKYINKAIKGLLANVSEDGKVMNVSGGTAVMRDKEGYRGIPKAYIQGWGQGLALSFFATLLISDDIEKDGAL